MATQQERAEENFNAIPVSQRPGVASRSNPTGAPTTVSPERLEEERGKAVRAEIARRRTKGDEVRAEIARRQTIRDEEAQAIEDAKPQTALEHQARTMAKAVAGIPEAVATIGSGALAGLINMGVGLGGVIDAAISALPGGTTVNESLDRTANIMHSVGDALTFVPRTAAGKQTLEMIAAPLVLLDGGAQSVARVASNSFGMQDNKYVATAVYTTLIGIPELLGLKGARNLKVTQRTMGENVKKVKQVAKDLDLDLKQDALSASVVEAAKNMSPIVRAENADNLRRSLKEAREASAFEVDAKVQKAMRIEAKIQVKNVENLAVVAAEQLILHKYAVPNMPKVQLHLTRLEEIGKMSPLTGKRKIPSEEASLIELPGHVKTAIDKAHKVKEVDLMEIQTILHEIELDINKVNTPKKTQGVPKTSREDLALGNLKKNIENFLDKQYVDDMINTKRGPGHPNPVSAWEKASELRTAHQKRWTADKDIAHLIERNATPESVHAYLLGKSVTAPKDQAVAVIRRIKDVLGKDHPAVKGIRQDYLYEMVKDILFEDPRLVKNSHFEKFADVYDYNMKNNSRLMTELGIDKTALKQLRDFARVAQDMPVNTRMKALTEFIPNAIAKMGWGHGIAKAGLKVNIMSNVFKILLGRDRISQKQILAEAANYSFGVPILNKQSINAGRIVQAVILADLSEDRAR